MTNNRPTSFRLPPADKAELRQIADAGFYNNFAEAHRDAVRKGILAIKKERGI
ncbi:MAG: hypothetical protein Q8J68_09400 [Methanolobus sp.]|uniref:hypothetical protein n=1 Tax=Methanolobus sp. TaxID=1874737 RepID=UPI00272F10F9|nr:hypothetical protein [Methanolobus sp.]MDP2217488.1 hypothetical protein [Methanolobus sp.]